MSPLSETFEATLAATVQRCCQAYQHAWDKERAAGKSETDCLAQRRTSRAFRNAMPFLVPTPDGIDTFIACVTHGMILGAIDTAEGSKLLYAAQIAISSRRARLQSIRAQSEPKSKNHPTPLPLAAKPQLAAPQVPAKPQPAAPQVPPPPSSRPKPEQSNSPEPAPSPVTRQDPHHPPLPPVI